MTKIPITFQIISDLHIEYRNDEVPDPTILLTLPSRNENVHLILAGDIGSLYKIDQLTKFLQSLSAFYEAIYYIPGNHEYYTNTHSYVPFNVLKHRFDSLEDIIPNLKILNRNFIVINDVCIAGCTLWSNPMSVPRYIVRIPDLNRRLYYWEHVKDVEFLQYMINYTTEHKLKLIVVTHHCPTFQLISCPSKKVDKHVSLYATDLEYLLIDNSIINTWICGHIHINFDTQLTDEDGIITTSTRLIGNQRGKPKDDCYRTYNKSLLITV